MFFAEGESQTRATASRAVRRQCDHRTRESAESQILRCHRRRSVSQYAQPATGHFAALDLHLASCQRPESHAQADLRRCGRPGAATARRGHPSNIEATPQRQRRNTEAVPGLFLACSWFVPSLPTPQFQQSALNRRPPVAQVNLAHFGSFVKAFRWLALGW